MTSYPLATVIMPTHDHAELIGFAIASVLRQTLTDFELFVVGDGAPEETKKQVEKTAEKDNRIRYFDYPKGERHGEANRHDALMEAKGKIVLYCCDDDLWLSSHISEMIKALKNVDFCHSIHTYVDVDGKIHAIGSNIENAACRARMCSFQENTFGPTFAGHTMAAYRRLPIGWHPAPRDLWTDLHMWRQFYSRTDILFLTLPVVTAVHFPSSIRNDWTRDERRNELNRWSIKIMDDAVERTLTRKVLRSLLHQAHLANINKKNYHS